jgi:hypothetical protein
VKNSAAFLRLFPVTFAALFCLVNAVSAATFSISTPSTTAQTLGTGSGQTGTVTSTGTLTVSGSTVAVTISGNNATLTNSGSIRQTGTGRVIRDNTGVTNLIVTNNAGALMQAADADVIQMAKSPASVTLNNYGTMTSLNASAGGAQAVDFTAILSGSNTVNNYAGGIIQASEADAVRTGVNGVVNNAGTIKSTTGTGSSSDGVDAQNNTGAQITNETTGLIQGARHGITGGPLTSTETFTTSVTNNGAGIIQGDNGAGINLDGFNANQTATVINHGTITGNGVTGDGDGIDVDGLLNLTNTGTVRSINAFSSAEVANSEGISAGGGTITNSGTIEGKVAAGNTNAVGRGISIVGIDTATPGVREHIYGNTTITNQSGGLIRGWTDSGIFAGGPASGFTVTIDNQAGATIRGGGATAAAIQTGADNDNVINSGAITADSSGKAIDLGGGTNTLKITGGSASVNGGMSGGTGTSALTLDPGTGNTFTYAGVISNFNTVEAKSGTVDLSGTHTYTGATTVSGGKLKVTGTGSINSTSGVAVTGGTFEYDSSTALTAATTVNGGTFDYNGSGAYNGLNFQSGTLKGSGPIAADLALHSTSQVMAPGNSPGVQNLTGTQNWSSFTYQWETNNFTGTTAGTDFDQIQITGGLNLTGSTAGAYILDVTSLTASNLPGIVPNFTEANETWVILTASGGITGFDSSFWSIDLSGFDSSPDANGFWLLSQNGNSLQLSYSPGVVPEPSTYVLMLIGGLMLVLLRLRRGRTARS